MWTNTKYFFGMMLGILGIFLFVNFISGSEIKSNNPYDKQKETITFVSPYANDIKGLIDKYTKEGYIVKHLVSQSVSTSVSVSTGHSTQSDINKKNDLKGDIILVLEK